VENNLAKLQAVYETGLDITADLSQEELYQRVLKRVRELTRVRAAIVTLHDPQTRRLVVVGASGLWGPPPHVTSIPDDIGLMGQVIVQRRPAQVQDYQNWPRRIADTMAQETTAVACAPLILKDEVLGCLMAIDDRPGRKFGKAEINILELLAAQLAVALHNTRLYQEMQEHIAAQYRAEVNLIRSARLAAVGEMVAGVAHEINNPLASISGFLELALRELPSNLPQFEDLAIALSEARRAGEVVKRLLDFARQRDPEVEPANLNVVVQETILLLQHGSGAGQIQILTHFTEELPDVLIDRNQIKQVILNLAKNAIAAMPDGGELHLTTRIETHQGNKGLALIIEDTGEGIRPEDRERIFDPFFTTRPSGSGTGLGLSVTYAIVENHGGKIEVQSQVHVGSTFTVWLPLSQERRNG
jgi:signal transduction histidine kinase